MSEKCPYFQGLCQECPAPKCFFEEPDEEEDDICDYTGDLCMGDPMFCEECEILTGETRNIAEVSKVYSIQGVGNG